MDDRWVRMLMKLGFSQAKAEDRMSIFRNLLDRRVNPHGKTGGASDDELRKGVDGISDAMLDTVNQSERITPFLKALPQIMFILHELENSSAFGSLVGAFLDFFTMGLGASTDAIQTVMANIPGFGQAINFIIGIFVWPFLAMIAFGRKEFSDATEDFLKVIPLGIGKAMSIMFAKGDKFLIKMDDRWDTLGDQFEAALAAANAASAKVRAANPNAVQYLNNTAASAATTVNNSVNTGRNYYNQSKAIEADKQVQAVKAGRRKRLSTKKRRHKKWTKTRRAKSVKR